MKRISIMVLFILSLVGGLLTAPAPAALIVDTGHSNNTSLLSGTYPGFAAEFTLSQPSTITNISSWMYHSGGSNSLTAAIYTDGGNVPGAVYNNVNAYSVTFAIPEKPPGMYGTPGWYGPTALNWYLPAGTYWAVIRPISDTQYGQAYPSTSPPGPIPTGNALYYLGSWAQAPASYNLAWQINANPVPLPAAFWLLCSGLIGLIGIRRFRK